MYNLINVSELTSSATNSLIAKDNVCLNLIFQSLVHGQVKPLEAIEPKVLRGLGLTEFKAFNPSKYNSKNQEWVLNKDVRGEILAELELNMNQNSEWDNFVEIVMEKVNETRTSNSKIELERDVERKTATASKRKEKESTVASKKDKIGKAITREVEREGEELTADMILAQMSETLGAENLKLAITKMFTLEELTALFSAE